jgi:phosphate transport system permease protein
MTSLSNTEQGAAVGQVRLTGQARLAELARLKVIRKRREKVIEMVLLAAAFVSVFTTAGIVYILVKESLSFFSHVPLWDFPDRQRSGRRCFQTRTLASRSCCRARSPVRPWPCWWPSRLGTVIAIYLSEFAGHKTRETLKPLLEMLSGVPTIIYGYFALLFVTPLLQKIYPDLPGFNVLSAGLVMGIMIIPYVSSLSEDAMRAVPMSLREGSYAMGATRFQTAVKVVVPAALSGIASAYILGVSRAVGETMILAVAAGMQPNLASTRWSRRPPSRRTSFRWLWVICRTVRWATRPSSPLAWC